MTPRTTPALAGRVKETIAALDDGDGVETLTVIADVAGDSDYSEVDVEDCLEVLTSNGELYRPRDGAVRVTDP